MTKKPGEHHIHATSPSRLGANSVFISCPDSFLKASTISRTDVPVPVPRLNAWKPNLLKTLKAARCPFARSTTWM